MELTRLLSSSLLLGLLLMPSGRVGAQELSQEQQNLRQQIVAEWKQATADLFRKGVSESEIPLPQNINNAPQQVRRISADDFRKKEGQDFPIDTVQYSGPKAINLVLMGDGFTSSEYDSFKGYADAMVNYMFKQIPYSQYKEWFNIFYIKVDSKESGSSHPGYPAGSGCPEGSSLPIQNVDTYFNTQFDCYGIHRLIVVGNNKPYELLNAILPGYDIVGILANTTEYGGSGGSILVTTVNSASNEIFMHELGHTFGKLADEYFAGDFYLGESPNTSAHNTAETVPWGGWWGKYGVGAYKIGGSEKGNRYYKPVNGTCKMEYLNKQFCAPCRENIIKEIHKKVNILSSYSPSVITVKPAYEEETVDFEVEYYNVPRRIEIEWVLDGDTLEVTGSQLSLNVTGFEPNVRHELKVSVMDNSPYLLEAIGTTKTWYIRRQESTGIVEVTADDNGVLVSQVSGGLQITTPEYRQVVIYGIDGTRHLSRHIAGTETIALPEGTYIVEGRKYMIK